MHSAQLLPDIMLHAKGDPLIDLRSFLRAYGRRCCRPTCSAAAGCTSAATCWCWRGRTRSATRRSSGRSSRRCYPYPILPYPKLVERSNWCWRGRMRSATRRASGRFSHRCGGAAHGGAGMRALASTESLADCQCRQSGRSDACLPMWLLFGSAVFPSSSLILSEVCTDDACSGVSV